jgi:hypothetical protein
MKKTNSQRIADAEARAKSLAAQLPDADKALLTSFLNHIRDLYVVTKKEEEEAGGREPYKFITSVEDRQLLQWFNHCAAHGEEIDGKSVCITPRGLTRDWRGLENVILRAYPTAKVDGGIVRKGDTYNFAKESGRFVYQHKMSNPFAPATDIEGAYCVISIGGVDYAEFINLARYAQLKGMSKQKHLWDKFPDQFWRKSALRAAANLVAHRSPVLKEVMEQEHDDTDLEKASPLASIEAVLKDESGTLEQYLETLTGSAAKCADKAALTTLYKQEVAKPEFKANFDACVAIFQERQAAISEAAQTDAQ